MINGVLVERTVKDVTPALQTNSEGLQKVLEELVKQYKKQQEDMEKWKVKFSEMREDHLLTVFRNAEEEQHTGRPAIGDCQAVAYCGYTLLIHLISNTTSTEHIKQGECNDRLVLRHAWTLDETMLSLHKLCGSLAMQDAFMPDIIVDQKLFLYRQLVII